MMYETHITVAQPNEKSVIGFNILAHSMGWKPLLIELSSGTHSSQLMGGHKFEARSPIEAAFYAGQLNTMLSKQGVQPVRTKLEAAIDCGYDAVYYEAHHKIAARPREEKQDLINWLELNGMRLSFNKAGNAWYVTERNYRDAGLAKKQFVDGGFLLRSNFEILKSHFEAVLVDSNPDLDEGWF